MKASVIMNSGTPAAGNRGLALLGACIVFAPSPLPAAQAAAPSEEPPRTTSSHPAPAPPTVQQCVEAHERGQVLRIEGQLIESRSALGACAHDACPEPLKQDCVAWREEVSRQVPTVIFDVLTAAGALALATVTVGDRELTRTLDGRPLELDPGRYEFRFELPDGTFQVVPAMIKQGEKNIVVSADLREREATTVAPLPTTGPAQPPPPPASAPPLYARPRPQVIPTATYVLGGLAVASAGVAIGLGVSTNTKQQNALESCAPGCSKERVDKISTWALFTDASIAIAVSSAIGAALIYTFSEGEPSGSVTLRPAVSYAPRGPAYAGVGGAF